MEFDLTSFVLIVLAGLLAAYLEGWWSKEIVPPSSDLPCPHGWVDWDDCPVCRH